MGREKQQIRILCSTGVVSGRANGNDVRLPARLDASLPCDGWEFLMTTAYYAREAETLRAVEGLNIPVFHTDKRIGEAVSEGELSTVAERFTINCRMARQMGASLLVHHLWGGRASDGNIGRNIASYAPLREIAERHGLLLTIENVVCSQQDPLVHLRALAESVPDVCFTFDTKMAAFHSQTGALYRPEHAWFWPHVAHLHVNDYAGGHMDWGHMSARPLGTGHIGLDRFFAYVRQQGYAGGATYEATAIDPDGTVRTQEICGSLNVLRKGLIP